MIDLQDALNEQQGMEIRGECEKCGIQIRGLIKLCERCEKSKVFLESVCIFRHTEFKNKMFLLIQSVHDEIPIPIKGQQIRIRTQVSMNMLSIFLKILKKHGNIDELTISTYSFDRNSVVAILDLISAGKIKKFGLLMSDTYSYRYKPLYGQIIEEMTSLKKEGHDVWLCFATNHMKITLIKADGNYYQIEGSMNYSINNLCEQVSIENSKATYDYDFNLLSNVIPSIRNYGLDRAV